MNLKPNNPSPCPYFTKCGGCDHLDLNQDDYRNLKQQLLIKDHPDANWLWATPNSRRRITLQISNKNIIGYFAKKSREIIEIESCFTAEEEVSSLILPLKNFLKTQSQNLFSQATITLFDNGIDLILDSRKELSFLQSRKLLNFATLQNINVSCRTKGELTPICLVRKNQIFFPKLKIALDSDVFIQATRFGLENIYRILRNFLIENKDVKRVTDIYSGFGAYCFAIQDLATSIFAFEGDKKMADVINKNASENFLANKIKAKSCDLFSNPVHHRELTRLNLDLAIINPPRNGASPQIIELSKSSVKNVIYISCSPRSFDRDARILLDAGFEITQITALDQFYATKHLELVAIFQKIEKND